MQRFVRVLVPLRLDWIPVYRTELPLKRGDYVNVALAGRSYVGIVWETDAVPDLPPERILQVISPAEDIPSATEREMDFWKFISEYYLCTPGEVYRTARPAQLLRSEQAEIMRRKKAEARRLARLEALKAGITRLELRLEALEAKLSSPHRSEVVTARLTSQKEKLAARLAARREEADLPPACPAEYDKVPDSPAGKPLVIRGTERYETYLEAVGEALGHGGQVLILTPETAFCERLESFFSRHLGTRLHRADSAAARGRTAVALQQGESIAALSTKNGIFLPFRKLSLIIIDEEQDSLYKQNDNAPRYNGRDAALMLAGLHSAKVILGSPSPSLETVYNCMNGKFELLGSSEARGRLRVIDIKAEKKKNGMSGCFSRKLVAAIRNCGGKVTLVRGWEKPEQLKEEIRTLFPEREPEVLSLNELKRRGCEGTRLLAVLQADALVDDKSFRSDEKALQLVETLGALAPELIIQTAVSERFDGSKDIGSLLRERKDFGFPPYTRLVEVRSAGGEVVGRHFLKRGPGLSEQKMRILESLPEGGWPDVDPA